MSRYCKIVEAVLLHYGTEGYTWKQPIRSDEEKSLRGFESKCGVKAMFLPPADQGRIKEANAAVLQKLADRVFSKDRIDQIQKTLAEYRASH